MTVLEAVFIGSPIALVQSCELCHLFSALFPSEGRCHGFAARLFTKGKREVTKIM